MLKVFALPGRLRRVQGKGKKRKDGTGNDAENLSVNTQVLPVLVRYVHCMKGFLFSASPSH
jgi:hypothetical protein